MKSRGLEWLNLSRRLGIRLISVRRSARNRARERNIAQSRVFPPPVLFRDHAECVTNPEAAVVRACRASKGPGDSKIPITAERTQEIHQRARALSRHRTSQSARSARGVCAVVKFLFLFFSPGPRVGSRIVRHVAFPLVHV